MENKKLLRIIWIVAILLIIYQFAKLLSNYMISLQGALIFSVLLHPLYKLFLKKTKKQGMSALNVIVIVIVLVLIPFSWLSFSLVNQASGLKNIDKAYIDKAENFLASMDIDVNIEKEGIALLHNLKGAVFNNVVDIIQRATDFAINLFIFFFLMYYLLIHGPEVISFAKRYLPFDNKKNDEFLLESKKIVRAVAYGSALTALIQGILGGLGFWIFGLTQPLFWAFVMAIFSILPILGSWLVWVPGVLYLLSTGHYASAIGLLVWSLVVVAQSDNLLKPIITSKMGKIHPIVILLGVIVGIALFGMIGILSGPIMLGLLVLIVQYLQNEKPNLVKKAKVVKRKLW